MFDTLVESSKHGQENNRTGVFLFVTSVIYGVILLAIGIGTIIFMNPGLVDAFDVTAMIAPPPPPAAPPPQTQQVAVKNIPAPTTFTAPKEPPKSIPDPRTIESRPVAISQGVPGGVPGGAPADARAHRAVRGAGVVREPARRAPVGRRGEPGDHASREGGGAGTRHAARVPSQRGVGPARGRRSLARGAASARPPRAGDDGAVPRDRRPAAPRGGGTPSAERRPEGGGGMKAEVRLDPWIEGYLTYLLEVRRQTPRTVIDVRSTLRRASEASA